MYFYCYVYVLLFLFLFLLLRHAEQGMSPLAYGLLYSSCPVCKLFCSSSPEIHFYNFSSISVSEKIYIFRLFFFIFRIFYCVIKTPLFFFSFFLPGIQRTLLHPFVLFECVPFLLPTCWLYTVHCSKLSPLGFPECIYSIRVQFGLCVQLRGT